MDWHPDWCFHQEAPDTLFVKEVSVVSGITLAGDLFLFVFDALVPQRQGDEAAQGEERTVPHQILQILQDKI